MEEYWRCLGETLTSYYEKKVRLKKRIARLEEALLWCDVDMRTEVERVKRLCGIPYDAVLAESKTSTELLEELIDDRELYDGFPKNKSGKIRPRKVLAVRVLMRQ